MTFGRTRSRDRSRGNSSAHVPLVLDFRTSALSFGTTAPAGCGYTRAACVSSVQHGTSQVFDLSAFSATAGLLVRGRALDAWDFGIQLEEARTNRVPDFADYSAASWTVSGTVTRTSGQTGPTGTASATRLEIAAASFIYRSSTSLAGDHTCSQWMRPTTPPADVGLLSGGSNTVRDELLAAPAAWKRYVAVGVTPTAGTINSFGGDARANYVSFGAGARDWTAYGHQIESGGFPTSLIPTSGAIATRNATFLRALSATVTPKLATGRLSIELSFRAMGARTEYSGTRTLWYVDANNQAAFVASTGVLTVTVAGATNTCTLPAWARYDLVEISVQCGGGVATVVKYRLNSGAVTSLVITGTALGTHATGDVYLFSTNAGQHLSCWAYVAAFYAPGAPSWAS